MSDTPLNPATTTTTSGMAIAAASASSSRAVGRYLYSRELDFLLLGGASFIILPLLALVPESQALIALQVSFLLSFLINYPHFAHSYQIFYRDFGKKLRGVGYTRELSLRYAFAGLVVPVIIVGAFLVCLAIQSPKAMGLCASAMSFFVGWHYVKQGYGMLIVDSVLQRSFFEEREKLIFRANAYACWIFFFLLTSHTLHERDYLGLRYYFLEVSIPLLIVAGLVMAGTSAVAIQAALTASRRRRGPMPLNGYVAYIASLYVWLCVLFGSAVLYFIPAFHSLQYLAVVWRFETNREKKRLGNEGAGGSSILVRLATFIGAGILLGALGFSVLPEFLNEVVSYDEVTFGGQLFTFMFFIFINIHHYFLDNVMWRKDNPDVRANLFA